MRQGAVVHSTPATFIAEGEEMKKHETQMRNKMKRRTEGKYNGEGGRTFE